MSFAKPVCVLLCLNALSAVGQLWSSPGNPGSRGGLSHGRQSTADCPLPCGPSGCCNYAPDQCVVSFSRGYHCLASTMFAPGRGSAGTAPLTPGFGGPAAPGVGMGGEPFRTGGQTPVPEPPAGTGGGFPVGYDRSQQLLGTCSIATPPVVSVAPDGSMTAVGGRRLRGAEASEVESAPERKLAVMLQTGVTKEQCELNCVGNQNTCHWSPN
uniref:Apple domain-containing protein n=1 Tax=Chromera velia CCMP2878 TaxID=1169474 RepID=A0A0G4G4P8_9ALVE|eukprot:Cvel_547.t1-p1 / transcript=Cvel_547.t1 / gene=Cvel_547 / organism=Chromera_velia_CCMP2878 / gene_product=hypothetical protein / transcript_product=hypothetical protein / location=Cvel_scaffold17:54629-55599(-) / protein_length=211 / sequence_SO=supercontig / SO=protein_coding / is_pseudo=false